jgi:hypothetical protein
MKCFAGFLVIASVAAHGSLTTPVPRNNNGSKAPFGKTIYHNPGCQGDACLWFNEGCYNGCPNCTNVMPSNTQGGSANTYGAPNATECPSPTEPTLPDKYRTWNIGNKSPMGDFTKYHPWRSPGRAPVTDPCGLAGAYIDNSGGPVPEGFERGTPGSKLPPLSNTTTRWLANAAEEVSWTITANHGGGYSYSVCPKGTPLTEDCLRAHPLSFVGDKHTIRYVDGRTELQIPALDVKDGTFPPGSTWRVNPVPACNCDQGFGCGSGSSSPMHVPYFNGSQPVPMGYDCPTGTMFPVPFDYGYGHQMWTIPSTGLAAPTWMIVDQVRAPAAPGEYTLRWRWDTEQNSQIWTNCADIAVVRI